MNIVEESFSLELTHREWDIIIHALHVLAHDSNSVEYSYVKDLCDTVTGYKYKSIYDKKDG